MVAVRVVAYAAARQNEGVAPVAHKAMPEADIVTVPGEMPVSVAAAWE
jgi:hypothetical protein